MKKKLPAPRRAGNAGVDGLVIRKRALARRLWKLLGDDLAPLEAFADLLESVSRRNVR